MGVTQKNVEVKLPSGWDEDKDRVISTKTEMQVTEVDSVESALEHFGGESEFLEAINSYIQSSETSAEYQRRLSQVKPSKLSLAERAERAVSAMCKAGFSMDEARQIVQKKIEAGTLTDND